MEDYKEYIQNNKLKILAVVAIVVLIIIAGVFVLTQEEPKEAEKPQQNSVEYVDFELIESETLDGKYTLKANHADVDNVESYNWSVSSPNYRGTQDYWLISKEAYKQDDNISGVGRISGNKNWVEIDKRYLLLSYVDEHEVQDIELTIKTDDGSTYSTSKEIRLVDHQEVDTVRPDCTEHEYNSGDGSSSNPYTVSNEADLHCISKGLDDHYTQTSDIDLSMTESWHGGQGFLPIGSYTNRFTGSYDGNNHEIKNLYINKPFTSASVGLFGNHNGEVRNIDVVDANITGVSDVGVIGINYGVADTIHSSGHIKSNKQIGIPSNSIGGVIGTNFGETNDLTSTATVTGNVEYIGDIIGYNYPDR